MDGTAAPRTTIQVCGQCGVRWQVPRPPAQRCPKCHGALLPPYTVDPPRRTFRWVARKPSRGDGHVLQPPQAATPTPRYTETPRWGLHDPAPVPTPVRQEGISTLARLAAPTLAATAIMFGLASIAEIARYCVLLRNRTRLIDPALLAGSDSAVWSTSLLGALLLISSAIATTGWLIAARRRAFAKQGRRDPRRPWTIAIGCLVPIVNWVYPGVFLTEVAAAEFDGSPPVRIRRLVVAWWCAWVFSVGFAIFNGLWWLRDSLQDEANGVLYSATGDLIAAGVAVLTILVIRTLDGDDVLGRQRVPRRWVVATGPVTPVIEPIRPIPQPEPQEVVAK
ncbi:DUF4328 domain-containing protein [Antrihabitans sp. YC2-6]|uniref:DUF4328 domain-containing protein n=1 Tax=Antrihabitans sp. YC2-6 TaxID=2799498 RepID=UPI0018F407D7|nr:DUF4328 domain-containing protein [Antrihabitans sp. YC2-6]MBJ8346323.1 DUF4328 domain-containing protein [Antrihabitans sp. YC2-6]